MLTQANQDMRSSQGHRLKLPSLHEEQIHPKQHALCYPYSVENDLEFSSKETQGNINIDFPNSDSNEEHSIDVMFNEEGTSVAAPQPFVSHFYSTKTSTSWADFNLGLLSSSEPLDNEIHIDDQNQNFLEL